MVVTGTATRVSRFIVRDVRDPAPSLAGNPSTPAPTSSAKLTAAASAGDLTTLHHPPPPQSHHTQQQSMASAAEPTAPIPVLQPHVASAVANQASAESSVGSGGTVDHKRTAGGRALLPHAAVAVMPPPTLGSSPPGSAPTATVTTATAVGAGVSVPSGQAQQQQQQQHQQMQQQHVQQQQQQQQMVSAGVSTATAAATGVAGQASGVQNQQIMALLRQVVATQSEHSRQIDTLREMLAVQQRLLARMLVTSQGGQHALSGGGGVVTATADGTGAFYASSSSLAGMGAHRGDGEASEGSDAEGGQGDDGDNRQNDLDGVTPADLMETVCLLDIQCEALRADNAALASELRRRRSGGNQQAVE